MKSRKKIFLYFLFLPTIPMSCPAQFNTIQKQPQVVKSKPISDVLSDSESDSLLSASNRQSESLEFFDLPNHREIAIEYDIPLFVSVKDSMMMELLNRRTSVALPLDFIHVTSDYGYRRDPITRAKDRFHNGIDLRCAKGSLYHQPCRTAHPIWSSGNHRSQRGGCGITRNHRSVVIRYRTVNWPTSTYPGRETG